MTIAPLWLLSHFRTATLGYQGGVGGGCYIIPDFCTIAVMYRSCVRKRPISAVVAEYGSFTGKIIILWDDNIASDTNYAKSLFRALTPYRKWWSCQSTINVANDDELLYLASKSGCKQLFIGFESVSQSSLNSACKNFNRVDYYLQAVEKIHAHGIAVQAGFVFGFDNDTPAIFVETLNFLEAAGVQNATFNILTPFPGTRLFQRLEEEGRILTRDWSLYNGRDNVVFQPRQMSTQELLSGYQRVNQEFYSIKSIARRLTKSKVGLYWTLPLNIAYSISLRRQQL